MSYNLVEWDLKITIHFPKIDWLNDTIFVIFLYS